MPDLMPPPPTWTTYAQSFFTKYCDGCHDASDAQGRDYTQYDNVVRDEKLIACGVNPGPDPLPGCSKFPPPRQFPIGDGPKPTDDERSELVAWVAAGLPQ